LQNEVSHLKAKLQQIQERSQVGAMGDVCSKSIKPDFDMRIDTSVGGMAAAELITQHHQYDPAIEVNAHTVPEQGNNLLAYEQDLSIEYPFSFDQLQNVCVG